ncbi:hypothetical protein [Roseateles amylovorans]|uniref:Uncharacterized protein n=1 Tax=Roseateles amylovorans TaxID=2978473 RepID=A0ABY6B217_9BURK|nr:hypothetical protein [Roseateles amylovorans]UXH77330.1 hypothetical protein N4261_20325 [Roseateles amylovorans]
MAWPLIGSTGGVGGGVAATAAPTGLPPGAEALAAGVAGLALAGAELAEAGFVGAAARASRPPPPLTITVAAMAASILTAARGHDSLIHIIRIIRRPQWVTKCRSDALA